MKPSPLPTAPALPGGSMVSRPADTQSLMAATRAAFFTQLLAHRERRRLARTPRPSGIVPQHAA